MPLFKIVKGHDAWVKYATLVEADTLNDAECVAASRDYDGKWVPVGVSEFDHNEIMEGEAEEVASDCVLEEVTDYSLTPAERDTIIAALRYWQERLTLTDPHAIEDESDLLVGIATNAGAHPPLDADAIDALIEGTLNA